MFRKIVITIAVFAIGSFFANNSILAQGCSDAGFCTMGAMRPNQAYNKSSVLSLRSIELTQYTGVADFQSELKNHFYDYFLSYILDANFGIGNRFSFQIKLPYNFVFGTLANTQGIGDISIATTYSIIRARKWFVNGTLGGKLPTGSANPSTTRTARDGTPTTLPLPMYYSPTLGTFDFVAGISVSNKNWLFATGMQWALQSYGNSNEFLWGKWKNISPKDTIFTDVYPRANKLQRGFDVMARAERNFRFTNWNVYIGLLGIYRLTPDTFENPAGRRIKAEGSTGLAATGLIGGGYRFNVHSSLKILVGRQLVKRKFNPDGLSRLAVATIGYEYRF
jgi:hypothetical protein